MGQRRNREEWAEMLAALEQSGESTERFCAKRRIPVATLKWWRWNLRETRALSRRAKREDVRLVPVDVVGLSVASSAASRPSALVITVSHVEVRLEVGTDVGYVGALVAELRARC